MALLTRFRSVKFISFCFIFVSLHSFSASYLAGVNYSNGQLYALCFETPDGIDPKRSTFSVNGGVKPVSLAFYSGAPETLGAQPLKLLVADAAGEINVFNWGEEITMGVEPETDCDEITIEELPQLYSKSELNGPQKPDGLSVIPGEKLIVTDSASGSSTSKIWRFESLQSLTQDDLTPIATEVPHKSLEETVVIPQNVSATSLQDKLLVVANDPDAILLIDPQCTPDSQTSCEITHFIGGNSPTPLAGSPSGIAFLPSPNQDKLLISTSAGTITVYDISDYDSSDPQATAVLLENPSLVTGLGTGKFKIKITRAVTKEAIDNDDTVSFDANVYVAARNFGSVSEIKLEVVDNQVQIRDTEVTTISQGIEHARGLATISDDYIRVGFCGEDCPDEVTIDISSVIEHTIDLTGDNPDSILSGYIGESYQVLKDPRIGCNTSLTGTETQPLYISRSNVYLEKPDDSVDANWVEIPAHLCGSPDYDPHLILVKTVSDLDPSKVSLLHHAFDTDFDQNGVADLDCYASDRSQQPALGWSPIPGDLAAEDPIIEDQSVIDIVSECGTTRGRTKTLSYFILGLRYQLADIETKTQKQQLASITDQYAALIFNELTGFIKTLEKASLEPVINGEQCINAQAAILEDFQGSADWLQADIEKGRYRDILADMAIILDDLNANVLEIARKGEGCSQNYQGDLLSRARHIYFNMATKIKEQTWVRGCSAENSYPDCLQ